MMEYYKTKNMKNRTGIILLVAICLMGCENKASQSVKRESEASSDSVVTDSVLDEEAEGLGGLNAIRFNNFTDRDWYDNEYIRCLRSYLDDYNQGKIENSELEPYNDKVRGKFVIGAVEPFLFGGLFIQIVFVDHPEYIYSAWVYSTVDEETETIIDYEVREVKYEGETEFTKEDIQQFLKENHEQKVW